MTRCLPVAAFHGSCRNLRVRMQRPAESRSNCMADVDIRLIQAACSVMMHPASKAGKPTVRGWALTTWCMMQWWRL